MSKHVPNNKEFDRLVMELRQARHKLDELDALIQKHKAKVMTEKKVTVATILAFGSFSEYALPQMLRLRHFASYLLYSWVNIPSSSPPPL